MAILVNPRRGRRVAATHTESGFLVPARLA